MINGARQIVPARHRPAPRAQPILLVVAALLTGCGPDKEDDRRPSAAEGTAPAPASRAPELAPEAAEKLASLGYFDRAPTKNPEAKEVTRARPRAFEGLNLYSSRHAASAVLIDNEGEVLHEWRARNQDQAWMHVELRPNGDLLAITKLDHVALYDWKSRRKWKAPVAAHHDLDVGPNKEILALTEGPERYTYRGASLPLLEHYVVRISPKGKPGRPVALFPRLRDLVSRERMKKIQRQDARKPFSRRAEESEPAGTSPDSYEWAELMRRTFGFDVLACTKCGGRLKLIALIDQPAVIEKILTHLGLPTEGPRPRPARAPPEEPEQLELLEDYDC